MSLSFCCTTGVISKGTPVGNIVDLDGVPTYVSLPSGDYDKTKALLFLPDIFGIELPNGKLLADSFAAEGYPTYVIDYFNGDAVPEGGLNNPDFDLGKWFGSHGNDETRPPLDKAVAALKAQGITTFAGTGYCFGGRYVVDLVYEKTISVAITSHPSLLQFPEDIEKLKATGVPALFNTCENDNYMGPKEQAIADEVYGSDKNYKRTYAAGCGHGFAVRGDSSDPVVKAAKDKAFSASVDWLKAHF